MIEPQRRSRGRLEILRAEARCIYCDAPPDSLEHMPPLGMFKKRRRPSGLEFAACRACNNGTRAADLVASFMARLAPDEDGGGPLFQEARTLIPRIKRRVPGFHHELFYVSDHGPVTRRTSGGVLVPAVGVHASGPILKRHLDVFAAKLGMALYREHVGEPLPLDGAVSSHWFLNAGLAEATAEGLLRMMPMFSTLQQGSTAFPDQFGYRFNCDDRTIFAAFVHFHRGLYIFTIATAEPDKYPLRAPAVTASFLRPGGLTAHLSPSDLRSHQFRLA